MKFGVIFVKFSVNCVKSSLTTVLKKEILERMENKRKINSNEKENVSKNCLLGFENFVWNSICKKKMQITAKITDETLFRRFITTIRFYNFLSTKFFFACNFAQNTLLQSVAINDEFFFSCFALFNVQMSEHTHYGHLS